MSSLHAGDKWVGAAIALGLVLSPCLSTGCGSAVSVAADNALSYVGRSDARDGLLPRAARVK